MNIINLIKQIASRIKSPIYRLVYFKEGNSKTEVYFLKSPKMLKNYFGNQALRIERKGFKAYAINRNGIRSFNYDGIISITKLSLLEEMN